MFIFAGALIGAVIGTMTARKRGGKGLDIAQYAFGFGVAFAIVGLFLTVALDAIF